MWQDEKLSPLPPIARLVFIGLIGMADDDGRLLDNIKSIDGFIFPESSDSSRESIEILARIGRVLRYTSASGQKLLQIVNWSKHQKVDNHAKYTLPGPTPEDYETQPLSGEVVRPSPDPREDHARPSRSDLRSTTEDLRPGTDARRTTRSSADADVPPWVTEGVAWWSNAVGRITPRVFRRTLSASVEAHAWEAVYRGLQAYVGTATRQGRSVRLQWFTDEDARWIADATPKIIGAGGNEAEILAFAAGGRQ